MKVDRLTSSPHHKGVASHAIMTGVEQHASCTKCTKVAEEPLFRVKLRIKLHTNYLSNPKFIKLPDETKWHFFGMYLLACEGDSAGLIQAGEECLNADDIALLLHNNSEAIQRSIDVLVQARLVICDNGSISIANYEAEQESVSFGKDAEERRAKSRERQQKHRDAIKTKNDLQSLDLELDNIKKEKEEESEREKELDRDIDIDKRVTHDNNVTDNQFSSLVAKQEFPSSLDPNDLLEFDEDEEERDVPF